MKVLVVVACVLAAAAATPGLIGAPVAYSAPVAAAVVAPAVSSQYHAQDELGQYSYGYQGPISAKQEVRTADGITRGGYSYVDAHGLVQSAQYVSDPVNGFRVAATNLPVGPGVPAPPAPAPVAVAAAPVAVAAAPAVVEARVAAPVAVAAAPAVVGAPLPVADTPEVAAAKAAHFQAHAAAKAALYGRKKRSPGLLAAPAVASVAVHAPVAYAAPASVAVHAPVAYAAPASVAVHAPVAYAAPAVVHGVVPARSFAYSTVAAHPGAVVAAHPGAVVAAHPGAVVVA